MPPVPFMDKHVPFSFAHRVTVSPDVLVRVVGDESVLLNLKTEAYLGLDPVGTRMWQVLQESPTIQAAYDTLLAEYDVAPDTLRDDLDEFLDRLRQQHLIAVSHAGDDA